MQPDPPRGTQQECRFVKAFWKSSWLAVRYKLQRCLVPSWEYHVPCLKPCPALGQTIRRIVGRSALYKLGGSGLRWRFLRMFSSVLCCEWRSFWQIFSTCFQWIERLKRFARCRDSTPRYSDGTKYDPSHPYHPDSDQRLEAEGLVGRHGKRVGLQL